MKDKIIGILRAFFPHVMFILSAMFITFWIINCFNPAMEFLSSKISLVLMIVYFTLCFLGSSLYIVLEIIHWKKK